jgi:hypothetical protein
MIPPGQFMGLMPEILIQDEGSLDLAISPTGMLLPPEIHQLVDDYHPLGMEEGEPWPLGVKAKEIQLPPQLLMGPTLGLFEPRKMSLEGFLIGKGGSVNPGEHDVIFIPPPVGPRKGEKLHRPQKTRVRHMGSPAEIDKVSLAVAGNGFILQSLNKLYLICLPLLGKKIQSLLPGEQLPGERNLFLGKAAHLFFDLGEILFGYLSRYFEVIVEAVLDGRANGVLATGKESKHCLSQKMRPGVP